MKYIEKFTFVTFLVVFLVYTLIGYVFDIDALKVIVFYKNGVNFSLIAVFVPVIVSYIIYFCTRGMKKDL